MPSVCAQCGTALAPDIKFCEECGTPVARTALEPGLSPARRERGRIWLRLVVGGGALLLIAGSLLFALQGWVDPDKRANQLFVEASQLVQAAQESEQTSSYFEASKLHQAALTKLDKITASYPSSQVAVQLTSGQAKIGPYTLAEFRKFVQAQAAQVARAQVELMGAALDMFRLDVGRYPTSQEGLEALRERPSGLDRWDGPYLKKEIPRDPWGNAYVYRSPGEKAPYELQSYGADGVAGGNGDNADIKSWKG